MAEAANIISERFRQRDILITCRNSQGVDVRSTPVHVTRFTAVLEVYNPHSILQLSEVLGDFRITIGDRCIYSGRGVVSNLVNAGILLVVEVTLDDESWLDVDLFSPIAQPDRLRDEFDAFMGQWHRMQSIRPEFKVAVSDFQMLLAEVRRWLDQVELGVRSEPRGSREELEREVLQGLEGRVLPEIDEWAGRFDSAAEAIEDVERPAYRAYARRQIHSLVMCAPFVYRTYHKPLGYAGDYEMVNMILRDPYEGGTLFAKMVNVVFLRNPPAEAHRNRIDHLKHRLEEVVREAVAAGRRARILNLGCGPAREVERFIESSDLSDHADFTLMDFNRETLEFAGQRLRESLARHGRRTGLNLVQKSVNGLLKDASKPQPPEGDSSFDFAYCAGLFDYVSDRVCRRLIDLFGRLVRPGAPLLVTNVTGSKPFRFSMDYILEWHLLCRTREQMLALISEDAPLEAAEVRADATGVNLFLEGRRRPATSGPGQSSRPVAFAALEPARRP
ncbi:MAG: class I SAM-dependent methyltransferase [Verrucomicrobiales bacterium]|nr:class I SAM-dependent methyltransferase [Verrucomicrobiales bacterium]